MTKPTTRKRRMEEFNLNEISFVARGAQEPAVAAIIKNDLSGMSDQDLLDDAIWKAIEDEVEKNGDLVQMATSSTEGHQHAISVHATDRSPHVYVAYASSNDGGSHDHAIVMAPDGSLSLTENYGHTHEIDQVRFASLLAQTAMSGAEKASNDVKEAGHTGGPVGTKKEASMTDEEKQEMAALKKTIAETQAELAKANKAASMTDVHKAFAEKLDDEAKAKFIEKEAAERDSEIAKASEADAVIYKAEDGTVFRKSDDPRLVSMAKQRDEDRKELAKARQAREQDRLEKAAETDLQHLPKDIKIRAAVLKAVEGIEDEETRKDGIELLKAHNASFAPAYNQLGKSGAPSVDGANTAEEAVEKLDELAKAHIADKGGNYYDAYDAVKKANPELRKAASI